nr:SOS response-associated peptidase family protein [Novosphingobium sp. PhB165]
MCNLYRLTSPASAIAALFGAETVDGANLADVVAPTDPGLVVAEGQLGTMTWGFPRTDESKVTGKKLKPHAVYNARSEKLGSRFWRASFERRRCLIPVSAWAEAAGEEGRMTRTWFSLPSAETFAFAGIWRNSPEWGKVFTMLMVPGHPQMAGLNDRMPIILAPEDWEVWTGSSAAAAYSLCRTWEDRLEVESTDEPWSRRTRAHAAAQQLSLPL